MITVKMQSKGHMEAKKKKKKSFRRGLKGKKELEIIKAYNDEVKHSKLEVK